MNITEVRCMLHGRLVRLDENGSVRHVSNTMPCDSARYVIAVETDMSGAVKALNKPGSRLDSRRKPNLP